MSCNMAIKTHFSLRSYNTFGIDEHAEAFVEAHSISILKEALQNNKYSSKFILGGGSNILLTQPLKGLCIHIQMKGIRVVKETTSSIWVEAMAGENWHELVLWSLQNGYGGIENLALIPGNVGTAVIQNIGAYGVELKDVFIYCKGLAIDGKSERKFEHQEVKFGYRDSIFKNTEKGNYVITSLCLKLTKKEHHLRTDYGAIMEKLQGKEATPQNIAKAVIDIRKKKLPDPKVIGNGGSFFKNPIIPIETAKRLQKEYPNLPTYSVDAEHAKLPAGWLIEHCGYKGYRNGNAGVHMHQALVLVNYGNATGTSILELAQKIQKEVKSTFGILLEPEVNVY